MKIDKKNWRHWWYLIRSGVYLLIASVLRLVLPRQKSVMLYAHKYNGNQKAFFEYIQALSKQQNVIDCYFLTLDPKYFKVMQTIPELNGRALHLGRFRDVLKVARSSAIITDHGMHTLIILNKLSNIPFVDVWHGIPYKGFTAENFSWLQIYTEIWTTSPEIRKVYAKKFNLPLNRIFATGYARVDVMINKTLKKKEILKQYKIKEGFRKYVLIAPTWQQDDKGRSIVPFGLTPKEFFDTVNQVAKKNKSLVIFRAHLNANDNISIKRYSNVMVMPYSTYPVAEDFLYIADVLVTDWSSIAFDYLPLDRPVVFLDVPAPFKNGFTVGPKYRFGDVAKDGKELGDQLDKCLKDPNGFLKKHKRIYNETKRFIYGDTLDGKAAERYYKRLTKLVK